MMSAPATFRLKLHDGDPNDPQLQRRLSAVMRRLAADRMVLSHTDEDGFMVYVETKPERKSKPAPAPVVVMRTVAPPETNTWLVDRKDRVAQRVAADARVPPGRRYVKITAADCREAFAAAGLGWRVRMDLHRTTWNYFTTNPQDGGCGSNHCGTKAVALSRAVASIPPDTPYLLLVNGRGEMRRTPRAVQAAA